MPSAQRAHRWRTVRLSTSSTAGAAEAPSRPHSVRPAANASERQGSAIVTMQVVSAAGPPLTRQRHRDIAGGGGQRLDDCPPDGSTRCTVRSVEAQPRAAKKTLNPGPRDLPVGALAA